MERAVVRSSARLSGGGGGGGGNGSSNSNSNSGAAESRAAAAALAAERRARALERAREVEDCPRVLRDKCQVLARAVRKAKHLVVYTGAGISTAADIPDYRGPDGVWTRLQRGEDIGRVEVSRARPTFTHMALAALVARGAVKFVVSQNCDGLHVRSGLPRRSLAELHGDMFAERCAAPRCRRVLLRAFDTTQRTRRHAHGTRRTCPAPRCGRPLRDTIVHFGERARAAWPLNWAGALRHAAAADVILCLGSSLKVLRRYPRLWSMARPARQRPRLYIVNLQWTPKDAAAELKINARCDTVMRELARRLRLRVPRYRPARDPLLAHATPLAPAEQHTCSRPALPPPPLVDSDSSDEEPPLEDDSSASDSDDALPLRRLQERLRGAEPSPSPSSPVPVKCEFEFEPKFEPKLELKLDPKLEPKLEMRLEPKLEPKSETTPVLENGDSHPLVDGELRSFEVSLVSGAARILLRAEHAGAAAGPGALRRFRPPRLRPRPRPPTLKEEEDEGGGRLARLLRLGPRLAGEPDKGAESESSAGSGSGSGSAGEAGSAEAEAAAAAFIARAVLVCRAQLYPGLHTIVGAEAARARGACAWCARHFAARRCLWYPALDPQAPGRVWRRVRGRRYLCTCCPRADSAPPSADEAGEGGWYGKGYRKGRRRRR